jgi:predicted DNA-binding transcriptional regulator YafY
LGVVLRFFHHIMVFTGGYSWAFAIILLTVAVRIVLLPLDVKQNNSMRSMQQRQPDAATFRNVASALIEARRLRISYRGRVRNVATERTVSPQRLVHYRDNWYLDAYCHLRNDLRSFAVDAIRDAAIRETRAKEVPDAELDEYLRKQDTRFAGEPAGAEQGSWRKALLRGIGLPHHRIEQPRSGTPRADDG